MIRALTRPPLPGWLARLNADQMNREVLPLREMLDGSLYYPSSLFDGDPVKYLAGNVFSFIYVDYGVNEKQLMSELSENSFVGYHVLGLRDVKKEELIPRGWRPSMPLTDDGNPPPGPVHGRPFATWIVMERDSGRAASHGPERFSLLYLCGDGAATYQALYQSNKCVPKVLAIIQSGEGFGGNWTDFREPNGILARSVLENPAGAPDYMLYGGIGDQSHYFEECWPEYSQIIRWLDKAGGGYIGLRKKE